jgi:hypothetical protein
MDAVKARSAYVSLAKSKTAHDEMFFFNELRATIISDVLNFDQDLATAARLRWTDDKAFTEAYARWMPENRGRVVFVGIYAREYKVAGMYEDGSIRVRLKADGKVYEPDLKEQVKEPLLANYLPVFNLWETVFALHFPVDSNVKGASVIMEFPLGTRELALKD